MPELPSREVIREHEFEEQLAALVPNAEEADDFILGAEFVMAREPESGLLASPDGVVWALPMMPIGGRTVTLYYRFDARAVTLLCIVAFDD